ncbi:MAG: RNA polymerase sigma factor [Deltaproteobacteria bacterium]|nr:RNA polymerase sigma factor [Deltaproteobacteria bacterium]
MNNGMEQAAGSTHLNDDALMAQMVDGDLTVLGELYLRHSAMVHGALGRFAPLMPDAEIQEMSQEVFMLLCKKARHYRQQGKFRAFLYGIAVKKARTWQRNHLLRHRLLGTISKDPNPPWQGPTENCPSERTAQREVVRQVLQRLPKQQRAVLILYSVEGFNSEEIGEILNISPQGVRTRLFRARQTLMENIHSDDWLQSLQRET